MSDCYEKQEMGVTRAGRVVPELRDVSKSSTIGRPQPGLDTSAVRRDYSADGCYSLGQYVRLAADCGRGPPMQSPATV